MAGVHDFLLERVLRNDFLVDFYAEAGPVGNQPVAVLRANRAVDDVVIPGHGAGHLFLDDEIRRGDVEMQCGDAGQRSERIMRRDTHAGRVRHGCYFARLGKAADVAKIGLGDVTDERLERNINVVVEANGLTRKPSKDEVFSRAFLPPRADRPSKLTITGK